MKAFSWFFPLIGIIISPALLSQTVDITEASLLQISKGKAPGLDMIKSSLLSTQTNQNLANEQFAAEVFGRGSYAETQERPIIQFIPIFTPVKMVQLGVRKRLGKGISTEGFVSSDQRSAASPISGRYKDVTTTIISLTVQMDLWRDLFGRVTDAERDNASLEFKRAELEEKIQRRAFEITLRKIYWSLVATQEQLKISERLKVTAGQQVADAQKKLKNSIGDIGEVSRYEAQLASRSGQVIYLNFQRESLIKQLKNLLPDLGASEVRLGAYDLNRTISEVVHCSAVINQNAQIPYNYTQYDEMLGLLKKVKTNQQQINERYSDIDLKFYGTVKSTGVGSDLDSNNVYQGSFGDSTRDMTLANRTGYETGILMNIPLGDAKKLTADSKARYDELRLKASIDQSEAQIVSTHTQLARSMGLIGEVIATQKLSSAALERRLTEIRKKYYQARVSVNDLILDQDALLSSELTTIDAQLEALNVVFDYLMIFTDTPCPFNRS